MAARKSGLGRGLDALIPVDHPSVGFAEVELSEIAPNPQQPRVRFDEESLGELAASITEVGVLQPIVVRPGEPEGTYVLIAGERRVRAAAAAGLTSIPAVIRSAESDERYLTEALIENVQRKDLSALEEAAAYRNLLEDFGMTHEAGGVAGGEEPECGDEHPSSPPAPGPDPGHARTRRALGRPCQGAAVAR